MILHWDKETHISFDSNIHLRCYLQEWNQRMISIYCSRWQGNKLEIKKKEGHQKNSESHLKTIRLFLECTTCSDIPQNVRMDRGKFQIPQKILTRVCFLKRPKFLCHSCVGISSFFSFIIALNLRHSPLFVTEKNEGLMSNKKKNEKWSEFPKYDFFLTGILESWVRGSEPLFLQDL